VSNIISILKKHYFPLVHSDWAILEYLYSSGPVSLTTLWEQSSGIEDFINQISKLIKMGWIETIQSNESVLYRFNTLTLDELHSFSTPEVSKDLEDRYGLPFLEPEAVRPSLVPLGPSVSICVDSTATASTLDRKQNAQHTLTPAYDPFMCTDNIYNFNPAAEYCKPVIEELKGPKIKKFKTT
jgi:hypothetical protein